MCHWKRWVLPGLLTVAILTALAAWLAAPSIERELAAGAESRLARAGLGWAKVEMDGRDATLTGVAPDEGLDAGAVEAATGNGVRAVAVSTTLLPLADPYRLSAARDGNRLTLTGNAPTVEARDALLAAAKDALPDAEVVDELELARGAPESYGEAAAFGLAQIGRLEGGSFTLEGNDLTVSGAAADDETFDTVNQALAGTLPAGIALGSTAVEPPLVDPYTFSVSRDGTAVSLQGYAPSAEERARIETQAAALAPDASVDNALRIARGAPDDFPARADAVLAAAAGLGAGTAALSGNTIDIEGTAVAPQTPDIAGADPAAGLPAGITIGNRSITPATVDTYMFGVVRSADGIELTGYAPSVEAAREVERIASRAAEGGTVKSGLLIAGGAPDTYRRRAVTALAVARRLETGEVRVVGDTLRASGTARTPRDYERIVRAFQGDLPAGLTLDTNDVVAPAVEDYALTAEYDGTNVRLSGHAPTIEERAGLSRLVGEALPDARVVDDVRIAAGAPEGYGARAAAALGLLPRLSSGSVRIDADGLDISGEARSSEDFEALRATLEGLPAGLVLRRARVNAPGADPYEFGAVVEDGRVRLTGHAPSLERRDAILEEARTTLPGREIVSELAIAEGVSDARPERVTTALAIASRLEEGSVGLSNGALTLSGTARGDRAFEAIADLVSRGEGAGTRIAANEVRPPTVSPYRTALVREGEAVRLEGFAPSLDAVRFLAETVTQAVPGATVSNRLAVAAGAPSNFDTGMAEAVRVLPNLSQGRVSFDGGTATVSGTARDGAAFEDIAERAEAAGWDAVALVPPSVDEYRTRIEYDGSTVRLTGFAPDRETREAISAALAERLPDARIENGLAIAAGAPDDLTERVARIAGRLPDLARGTAEVGGERVALTGTARDVDAYERLSATRRPGVTIAPATADDYTFTATREGDVLRLEGYIPDEASREAIRNAVPTGLEADDRTRVAAGAPDGFTAAAAAAVSRAEALASGTVTLSAGRPRLSGTAATSETYADLVQDDGIEKADVIAPPVADYRLRAVRGADAVSIEGNVPDPATREAVISAARAALPNANVEDRTIYASGAPEGLVERAREGFALLPRLAEGEVKVAREVAVTGRAASVDDYEALREAGAGVTPAPVAPYVTTLRREGDRTILEGYAPDDATRDAIAERASVLGPVDNRLRIAAGAPDNHAERVTRAADLLARTRDGTATVNEDISITGTAASVEDYEALREAGVEGVIPATVTPYAFEVAREGDVIGLTGFAPSEAERERLARAAASTGLTVRNDLRVAGGAPDGFGATADTALAFAGAARSGRATLTPDGLALTGDLAEPGALERFAALPGVKAEALTPSTVSPYTFGARLDGDAVRLDGHVPDEATRSRIVAGIAEVLPEARVEDETVRAAGAPADFAALADRAVRFLPRARDGRATIEDERLALSGTLETVGDYEVLADGVDARGLIPAPAEPYRFETRVEGGRVVLEGNAPDPATRDRLVTRAADAMSDRTVRGDITIASGAPDGFERKAGTAVEVARHLADGRAALSEEGDLIVEGTARDTRGLRLAQALLAREGVVAAIAPPRAEGAYTTTIERASSGTVVLSGAVPDAEARAALRTRAEEAFPTARIVNRTAVYSGAPVDHAAGTDEALAYLSRLESGRAVLEDGRLSVEGRAGSVVDYEAAIERAARTDAPVALSSIAVEPATVVPYTWSLTRANDRTVLSGFVPSDTVRKRTVAAAERAFEAFVDDRQRIAAGAPEGFAEAVDGVVAAASGLERARIGFVGTRVRVDGRAPSEESAAARERRLSDAAGAGFALRAPIHYPPPPAAIVPVPPPKLADKVEESAETASAENPSDHSELEPAEVAPRAERADVPSPADSDTPSDDENASSASAEGAPADTVAPSAKEVADANRDDASVASEDGSETASSDEASGPPATDEEPIERADAVPASPEPDANDAEDRVAVLPDPKAEPGVGEQAKRAEAPSTADPDRPTHQEPNTNAASENVEPAPSPESPGAELNTTEAPTPSDETSVEHAETDEPESEGERDAAIAEVPVPAVPTPEASPPTSAEDPEGNSPETARASTDDEVSTPAAPSTDGTTEQDEAIAVSPAPENVDGGDTASTADTADGSEIAPSRSDEMVADPGTAETPRTTDGSPTPAGAKDETVASVDTREDGTEAASDPTVVPGATSTLEPTADPEAAGEAEVSASSISDSPTPDIEPSQAPATPVETADEGAAPIDATASEEASPVEKADEPRTSAADSTGEQPEGSESVVADATPDTVRPDEGSVPAGNDGAIEEPTPLAAREPDEPSPTTDDAALPSRVEVPGETSESADTVAEVDDGAARVENETSADATPTVEAENRGVTESEAAAEGVGSGASRSSSPVPPQPSDAAEGRVAGQESDVSKGSDEVETTEVPRAGAEREVVDTRPGADEPVIAKEDVGEGAPPAVAARPKATPAADTSSRTDRSDVAGEAAEAGGPLDAAENAPSSEAADLPPTANPRAPSGERDDATESADTVVPETPTLEGPTLETPTLGTPAPETFVSEAGEPAGAVQPREPDAPRRRVSESLPGPKADSEPEIVAVLPDERDKAPRRIDPGADGGVGGGADRNIELGRECVLSFEGQFDGERIGFASNRAVLRSSSLPLLDRLADAVRACPGIRLRITGHTDDRGYERFNLRLSRARARAVRDHMVQAGVDPATIEVVGRGESLPVASNRSREGRARNRRIEIDVVR